MPAQQSDRPDVKVGARREFRMYLGAATMYNHLTRAVTSVTHEGFWQLHLAALVLIWLRLFYIENRS